MEKSLFNNLLSIKEIRNKLNLTAKELSKALECSQNYIYAVERGEKKASIYFLFTANYIYKKLLDN
jgi:transcriptional regulator with XRE-family HTH domain